MNDIIKLEGICVYAHHGVHPAERELGQRFVIDVALFLDCSAAAVSDNLEDALDYSAVHGRIREIVAAETFNLLEALANQLCRIILMEFQVERVSITVQKLHPPLKDFTGSVSVTLDRDRASLDFHEVK